MDHEDMFGPDHSGDESGDHVPENSEHQMDLMPGAGA